MDRITATVLITTKDRREVLRRAVDSVLAQRTPVEILIVDDGSSDDTSGFVSEHYPGVRLVRNETARGIIDARNRAAEMIQTPILFTLDDDAEFSSPDTVERALACFEHPRVGVVTLPLIDHIDGTSRLRGNSPRAGDADFPVSRTFLGGANALRLDAFRALGGYGGHGRQGEEMGYALRLLDRGLVVRIADTSPVNHYPVRTSRDVAAIVHNQAKNGLAFAWEYVPAGNLPVHAGASVFNSLRHGARQRSLGAALSGVAAGAALIARGAIRRSPVRPGAYQLSRRLTAAGELPISAVEPMLPPASPGETP